MTSQRQYHAGDAIKRALRDVVNGLKEQSRDLRSEYGNQILQIRLASEKFQALSRSRGMSAEMIGTGCDFAISEISKGNELCESPIERLILPWLVMQDYGVHLQPWPAAVHIPKQELVLPKGGVVIVPQFAFARFRVDFAVVGRHRQHSKIVAIECDGESYHDAERDRLRDEYLASWNIKTIRSRGASISRDPSALARQAAAEIIEWADSVGVSYG